jgi:trimeric autotransporter adhesin
MARKFLTPIDLNKLELQNAAIQNLATPPGTPATGQVYYNTVDSKIKVWTGSAWANVGGSQEEIEDYIDNLLAAGNGVSLTYDDDNNILTVTNTGVLSVTGGTDIDVDASTGDVTISLPATIASDTTGNAATATTASGVVANSVALGTDTTGNYVATVAGSSNVTVTGSGSESAAVSVDLPSSISVDVTGDLTGNADTATALQTARTISITGDATASASFDGTSDISLALTIDSNSAVSSITGTANEVEVSASVGAVTIGLPDDVVISNDLTVSNDLVVTGDLTVNGLTTTVNTETINLADNIITLNSNATGAPTENAGVEIERGDSTNVAIRWNETSDKWQYTEDGTSYLTVGSAEDISALDSRVTTNEGDISTLQSDVSTNASDISGLDSRLTTAESNISTNASDISGLDSRVTTNEGDISTNASDISGLDSRLTTAEGNISTNASDISTNASDISSIQAELVGVTHKVSASVGNGSNLSFALTHNLNTLDVVVSVHDNATKETVECDVVRTDADTVTVSFAVAPSANAYRVVIVG